MRIILATKNGDRKQDQSKKYAWNQFLIKFGKLNSFKIPNTKRHQSVETHFGGIFITTRNNNDNVLVPSLELESD